MAESINLVNYAAPDVTVMSKADTANWQYLAVQLHNAGVCVADARSLGATYILPFKVNSGQNVSLASTPNIEKAIASEAILRGQYLKVTSATGLVSVTSGGDSLAFATAWGTAAGSGVVFPIQLK